MNLPDKIYIIGWFGSGKSLLAERIHNIKKVSYFDLDDIRWAKKYTEKLSEEKRKYKIQQILKQYKKWIVEWCVIDWADICYNSADLVIVLKISWYVAVWRVFKRYISRIFHWEYAWSFLWTLSLMYRSFMYYQKPKGKYSFHRHIEDCKKYNCNYIIIRDAKEILC